MTDAFLEGSGMAGDDGFGPQPPGTKHDSGKPRAALLGQFARALQEVASVATFGAAKYSDHGWLHVPDGIERYSDAMLRHLLAEYQGSTPDAWARDQQSGCLHAAHTAWNALARLDLMLRTEESEREGMA